MSDVQADVKPSQNAITARLRLADTEEVWGGGATLPTRLCLRGVGGTAVGAAFGDAEVAYHTAITAGVPPSPAPTCCRAADSATQGRYPLLLEDLSDTHEANPHAATVAEEPLHSTVLRAA